MRWEDLRPGSVLLHREMEAAWLVVGVGSKPGQINWFDLQRGCLDSYDSFEPVDFTGPIEDIWEIIL